MKALFIPLKTEYYEQFEAGTKTDEYRLYGARWNEKTCFPGRPVTLSKGYGKKNRLEGVVRDFTIICAQDAEDSVRDAVMACYGTIDAPIARISINRKQ